MNKDDRYAVMASRANALFVLGICIFALRYLDPLVLVFIPTEFVFRKLMKSRKEDFVSICTSFAVCACAFGTCTYGIAFIVLGIAENWNKVRYPTVGLYAALFLISILAPYILVIPILPLLMKRWIDAAIRLPLCIYLFMLYRH